MAKTCGSCGLMVSDDAHFCEKCGYPFANSSESNVTAISGNSNRRSGYIVLLVVMALIAFAISHFHSPTSIGPQRTIAAEGVEPQPSGSAEDRAQVVRKLQGDFKDGLVSEQGDLLQFEYKSNGDPLWRAAAWKAVIDRDLVHAYNLCELGFRRMRLSFGSIGENFSLGCGSSPPSEVAALMLISNKWHKNYGYAVMEGRVMNMSQRRLANVEAVATFYDASGGFVTSSDGLIDYNPILPGQISAFKVTATYNPAMRKASVEFKYLMGGSIPFVRK
jgi:hypothetical protein